MAKIVRAVAFANNEVAFLQTRILKRLTLGWLNQKVRLRVEQSMIKCWISFGRSSTVLRIA